MNRLPEIVQNTIGELQSMAEEAREFGKGPSYLSPEQFREKQAEWLEVLAKELQQALDGTFTDYTPR
jgi:hypothetical protein